MNKVGMLAAIGALAIVVTAISALLPAPDPPVLIALFYLDLLVPIVGGIVALVHVARRPASAPGLLAVGLYALTLAVVFAVLPFRWFPSDNTGLGMVLLAFLTVLLALPLLLVSLLLVVRRREGMVVARTLPFAASAAVITMGLLLARGPGDWASASPSVRLYSFPLMVLAIALCLAILDRAGRQRPGVDV